MKKLLNSFFSKIPIGSPSRRTTFTSSLKLNIHGPADKYRMVVTRQSLRNARPNLFYKQVKLDIYERRRARFFFYLGNLLHAQAYSLFIELLLYFKLCIFLQEMRFFIIFSLFSRLFSFYYFLSILTAFLFTAVFFKTFIVSVLYYLYLVVPSNLLISSGGINFVTPTSNFVHYIPVLFKQI
jgi:hypothetical protein